MTYGLWPGLLKRQTQPPHLSSVMTSTNITIIHHSERVEQLLSRYADALGPDHKAYRAHIYRVLTYAMHFLGGAQQHRALVETALVYHDIALWTDHDLAYLEPSEAIALRDNQALGWELDPELLRKVIHWHHKVTAYQQQHPGAEVVEAVRKADWIDASGGVRRMGLSRRQVREVQEAIPHHGFPDVLQRLAKDLGGNALQGNLRVLRRVFKW